MGVPLKGSFTYNCVYIICLLERNNPDPVHEEDDSDDGFVTPKGNFYVYLHLFDRLAL